MLNGFIFGAAIAFILVVAALGLINSRIIRIHNEERELAEVNQRLEAAKQELADYDEAHPDEAPDGIQSSDLH